MRAGPSACLIYALVLAAVPCCTAVKLQIREGRPVVDGVYVNGHGPYRFLVDTGANVNLLETGVASAIGITPTFSRDLASSVGRTPLPGSDGNLIELGPVKAEGQRFLLSGLTALHVLGSDIHGVLSQEFLSGFDYMLDLRGRNLEFGKRDREGSRSRFTRLDGRTAISTSLGDLVLDSGIAQLMLFGVEAGPREELRDMRTIAGTQLVGMVSSSLVIEGRNIWRGAAVAIPDRTEPGVAGLLPLNLFRTVYVCNSEGYVIFE